MIVDCHTHIWSSASSLGKALDFGCLAGRDRDSVTPEEHLSATEQADFVLVLGFISNHLNTEVSNDALAAYVAQNAHRMLAFAGVDPTEPSVLDRIQRYHEDPSFGGLTLGPGCQGYHACDSRVMRIYELAEELGMPVYFLQGDRLPQSACLEFQQPVHLDEVANAFPSLKIVVSHMGFPWMDQMVAILGKHANVYADIAGLASRPWQAYRALIIAYEYSVIEKLLFASDFPNHSVKDTVEAIYNLNKLTLDSVLPPIPREQLRGIVERDSLSLLGLAPTHLPAPAGEQVSS